MKPLPPHHNQNGTFRNCGKNYEDRGFFDMVKWITTKKSQPRIVFPIVKPDLTPWLTNDTAGLHALWIGHATWLLRIRGVTVLTDPIFSDRATPISSFGPKRTTPPALTVSELPDISIVVLSHDHYDHADLPSLRALALKTNSDGSKVRFIVPLGFARWFKTNGLPVPHELDWWEHIACCDATITSTPVQHWCKRGLSGMNDRLWCGFMIEHKGKKVYFSGDTGYSEDFIQTYANLGAPDVALLPIGAYAPRWFMKPQHINPEDTQL